MTLERAERHRNVGAGDACRWRVEVLESLTRRGARDVRTPSAGERVLLDDGDAARAFETPEDGPAIPRSHRAEVDHLARHVGELLRGGERDPDHLAERDNGDVGPGARDSRRADGPQPIFAISNFAFRVVEAAGL